MKGEAGDVLMPCYCRWLPTSLWNVRYVCVKLHDMSSLEGGHLHSSRYHLGNP